MVLGSSRGFCSRPIIVDCSAFPRSMSRDVVLTCQATKLRLATIRRSCRNVDESSLKARRTSARNRSEVPSILTNPPCASLKWRTSARSMDTAGFPSGKYSFNFAGEMLLVKSSTMCGMRQTSKALMIVGKIREVQHAQPCVAPSRVAARRAARFPR